VCLCWIYLFLNYQLNVLAELANTLNTCFYVGNSKVKNNAPRLSLSGGEEQTTRAFITYAQCAFLLPLQMWSMN
jgi:hypothetical protein